MIDKQGTTAALEKAYDLIADGIDRAGEAKAPLFLAKLSRAGGPGGSEAERF
jgi:hypothetical protein